MSSKVAVTDTHITCDRDYDRWLALIRKRIQQATQLFVTDTDGYALYELYLNSFHPDWRQHHACGVLIEDQGRAIKVVVTTTSTRYSYTIDRWE